MHREEDTFSTDYELYRRYEHDVRFYTNRNDEKPAANAVDDDDDGDDGDGDGDNDSTATPTKRKWESRNEQLVLEGGQKIKSRGRGSIKFLEAMLD